MAAATRAAVNETRLRERWRSARRKYRREIAALQRARDERHSGGMAAPKSRTTHGRRAHRGGGWGWQRSGHLHVARGRARHGASQ